MDVARMLHRGTAARFRSGTLAILEESILREFGVSGNPPVLGSDGRAYGNLDARLLNGSLNNPGGEAVLLDPQQRQ